MPRGFLHEFWDEGLSALLTGWRTGFAWMGEDLGNGLTAVKFRFTQTSRSPLNAWLDVPRAIPIVGLYTPVSMTPVPDEHPEYVHRLYLTRGVGGSGDENDSDVINWTSSYREAFAAVANVKVEAIPYRYGGFIDAIAAQLNLSQGAAYDMADRIVRDLEGDPLARPWFRRREIHLWMASHSAGVQRSLVAAKLLKSQCDIVTERRLGMAGPNHGLYSYPVARRSNQMNFLNGNIFQLDPITWIDLALIVADPFSWVLSENRPI